MIYRYCRRRVGERTAAEDACSAVFLAIAEQMSSFEGESEIDFRKWAFGVARRKTASMVRMAERRRRLLEAAARSGTLAVEPKTEGELSVEGVERLPSLIATLKEHEQTLLDLRYGEGLAHDEIGKVVGMRGGAVRTALCRAVAKLRRHLLAENP